METTPDSCMVPCLPHSPDSSQGALQGSGGGTSQKRMVGQWPALKGRKISQTVFTLDPCAMRPAHVHQRADGLLYVISGKLLRHWPSDRARGCQTVFTMGQGAPAGCTVHQQ